MSSYDGNKGINIDFNEINESTLKLMSQKGKECMINFPLMNEDNIKNLTLFKLKKIKKNGNEIPKKNELFKIVITYN